MTTPLATNAFFVVVVVVGHEMETFQINVPR